MAYVRLAVLLVLLVAAAAILVGKILHTPAPLSVTSCPHYQPELPPESARLSAHPAKLPLPQPGIPTPLATDPFQPIAPGTTRPHDHPWSKPSSGYQVDETSSTPLTY
jgi:hypothetical protein